MTTKNASLGLDNKRGFIPMLELESDTGENPDDFQSPDKQIEIINPYQNTNFNEISAINQTMPDTSMNTTQIELINKLNSGGGQRREATMDNFD